MNSTYCVLIAASCAAHNARINLNMLCFMLSSSSHIIRYSDGEAVAISYSISAKEL